MEYSFYYILLLSFLSLSYELSLKTKRSESQSKISIVPKLDNLSTEKELGVLHTLRKYIEWNFKEEKLVKCFTSRIKQLQVQYKLFKRLLFGDKFKSKNSRHLKVKMMFLTQQSSENTESLFRELDLLGNRESKIKWVNNNDLLFSMTGLKHLQDVYYISASQMSKGLNIDSKFGGFLSPLEMVLQALYCLSQNRFVTAIKWLQEAIGSDKKRFSQNLLDAIYRIAVQTHNTKYLVQTATTEQYTNIRTDYIEDVYQVPILNGLPPPERYSKRIAHFKKYGDIDLQTRFSNLCKGHNLQSPKELLALHCYYDNKRHPYLYINPMKVEQLSLKPLILQYYEIMSKSTIEAVVKEVGPHATTLKLWFDDNNFAYGSAPYTVSNSACMGINFGKVSKATHKLTEILSGLKIWDGPNHNRYREHVYGRYLNMHNDGVEITYKANAKNAIPEDDDIMATMLFYLRVPQVGGCTAFVHTGVCSREVSGSATFWYNMYKNGSYTMELRHGSCPVLHGDKIAITLFLKHNANWNTRLCSKDQFK